MISKRLISRLAKPSGAARPLCSTPIVSNRVSKLVKAVAADAPPVSDVITEDPANNVTENIFSKIGVNLHRRPAHPLFNIRQAIYEYFDNTSTQTFRKFDDLYPIVSTEANFDSVLVPEDHVSRSPNDTYYISSDTVLRCAVLKRRPCMLLRNAAVAHAASLQSVRKNCHLQMPHVCTPGRAS
jgi:phenylalanyl-tRNA synthetase alpha subunit